MPAYVGAIDQGTTSSRFIVFDRDGAMVSVAQREHAQIYPAPGHVEHDPEEIWRNTKAVIADALAAKGLAPSDLAAVSITNQRETTLLWDRRTGRPLHNALVWQDTRVDTLVAALARDGGKDRLRGKTGLPLDSRRRVRQFLVFDFVTEPASVIPLLEMIQPRSVVYPFGHLHEQHQILRAQL